MGITLGKFDSGWVVASESCALDQIGATYDELEWAMLQDEQGKSSEDFEGRQKQVFSIYKGFNEIRWMQAKGGLSHLLGTKYKFK